MVKMTRPWTGKKSETPPVKKEKHLDRKTKEELVHRWQEDDWRVQVKEFINGKTL